MTRQIRTTLLTGLFFCGILPCLQAQDKYEYAIINYIPFNRHIEISINGVSFIKIDVPKEKVKGNADVNAGLEEMNKMIEQGWELFDTGIANGTPHYYQIYTFFLRKKK